MPWSMVAAVIAASASAHLSARSAAKREPELPPNCVNCGAPDEPAGVCSYCHTITKFRLASSSGLPNAAAQGLYSMYGLASVRPEMPSIYSDVTGAANDFSSSFSADAFVSGGGGSFDGGGAGGSW